MMDLHHFLGEIKSDLQQQKKAIKKTAKNSH